MKKLQNRFQSLAPELQDKSGSARTALHVKEIGEKDYEAEVAAAALPVVLDFFGADSPACEALAPRFGAVAEKFTGKARFIKVSRAANPALASRLGVAATPTIVFLHGGKELGERLTGDVPRAALKARVEALLAAVPAVVSATP